ncbi:S1 family peptidase [Dactylosporangium siamense]|uniref:Peptidase n=1 Tax=Dactylosporangium siamense TaxID=685454 RepID=A0A919PI16_9ACTN|nr:S1 family peptidase [Dactylosporangium siamense]GIG42303.1 peptidase [Dactylosporangium siamense]
MTHLVRRRAVAVGLIAGLLGLAVETVPAAAEPADPDLGPVRTVAAATADKVEVFAGDLTVWEAPPEAVAAALSTAYQNALDHPDDLSVPYQSKGTVVAPYASDSGSALAANATRGLAVTKAVKVTRSLAQLERIKFEAIELGGGIHTAFVDGARNQVIVEVPAASDELRASLAARYGQAVAIHLQSDPGAHPQDDGRANDNGNFEGGSDIRTNVGQCTSGFAFVSGGQHYLTTAGHCTTNSSGNTNATHSPNHTFIGFTHVDNWNNGSGSVIVSGYSDYHGDVAAIKLTPGQTATGYAHNGTYLPTNATSRLPVRNRLSRWLVPGDQYCSSGIYSGERCGWIVLQTNVAVNYGSGKVLRNGFIAQNFNGLCTRNGDSGAPLYARDSTSITLAVGLHSGANSVTAGTSSTPCRAYGTEMMHVWQQVPGDILKA